MSYVEELAQDVLDGDMDAFSELKRGIAEGSAEYIEAAQLLIAEGVDLSPLEEFEKATTELDETPLSGVDRGALESFIVRGRSSDLEDEVDQLAAEGDKGAEIALALLQRCAADGQEWAARILHRDNLAAEAMWSEELAGNDFDHEAFAKSYAAADANGEPEAGYGYYVDGRTDPDPPKIEARPAAPGEAAGGLVYTPGDNLDQALAEWSASNRNRENQHPEQLDADAREAGARKGVNAVTTAFLGEIADDWAEEGRIADQRRAASVKRHAAEAVRKGAAV